MGRFIYDSAGASVDIEDRTLAHLRIVIMTKLRRSESFMFEAEIGEEAGGAASGSRRPCRSSSTSSEAVSPASTACGSNSSCKPRADRTD